LERGVAGFLQCGESNPEIRIGTILTSESKEICKEAVNGDGHTMMEFIDMPVDIGIHEVKIKEVVKGEGRYLLDMSEKAIVAL
jgi:hypothetical protein